MSAQAAPSATAGAARRACRWTDSGDAIRRGLGLDAAASWLKQVAAAGLLVVLIGCPILATEDAPSASAPAMQGVPSTEGPAIEWERTISLGAEAYGVGVGIVSDGGFVVLAQGVAEDQSWLVRIDAAGKILWQKSLSDRPTVAYSLDVAEDGSLFVVGTTQSDDDAERVWMVKLDPTGEFIWERTYVGHSMNMYGEEVESDRCAYAGQGTSDGGYVIVGEAGGAARGRILLLKLDPSGDAEWERVFGDGSGRDWGLSCVQAADGGYVIAALSFSHNPGSTNEDIWLIRTDAHGEVLWDRLFGGDQTEGPPHIAKTADGGYVVVALTERDPRVADHDLWVFKISGDGGEIWSVRFDPAHEIETTWISEASDGGYLVCASYVGDRNSSWLWLMLLSSAGEAEWSRILEVESSGVCVQPTSDGGCVALGTDVSGSGGSDILLVKLAPDHSGGPEPGNRQPNPPANLAQVHPDGTAVSVGSAVSVNNMLFEGSVADPDGDSVRLEVELRRLDELNGGFDETQGGLKGGDLVSSGLVATCRADGLIGGDYHWRARTADEHGSTSSWVDFGGNLAVADFTVSATDAVPSAFAQRLEAFVERSSEAISQLLGQVQGETGLGAVSEYFETRVEELARHELSGLLRTAVLATVSVKPPLLSAGDPFILVPLDVWGASQQGESVNEVEESLRTYALQAIIKMREKLENAESHLSGLTEEMIAAFTVDVEMRDNAHALLSRLASLEGNQLASVKRVIEAGEPWEFVERLFWIPTFLIGRVCPYSWPVTLPLTVLSVLNTVKRMEAATVCWVAATSAMSSAAYSMEDIYENTIKALDMVISREDPAIPNVDLSWVGHQLCDYDEQFQFGSGTLGAKASSTLRIENRGSVRTNYKLVVTFVPDPFEPIMMTAGQGSIEGNAQSISRLEYTEAGGRRTVFVGGQEVIVTRYAGRPPRRDELLAWYLFLRTTTGLYAPVIGDTWDWNVEVFVPGGCPSPDPDVEIRSVISIGVHSPVTVCAYDASGNATGTVSGELRQEIPGSMAYEDGLVLLFDLSKPYRYVVTGTEQGTYGLTIAEAQNGHTTTFAGSDIPSSPSTVHQYTIDWAALARGDGGATLQINEDGDGLFERAYAAGPVLDGRDLQSSETLPQTKRGPDPWLYLLIGAALAGSIIVGIVLASRQRRSRS